MESNPQDPIIRRLDEIQNTLNLLVDQRTVKEFYTTGEVAKILGKSHFTVREWCRLGLINAERRDAGRGEHGEWKISHAELLRYQNEGLLPVRKGVARL